MADIYSRICVYVFFKKLWYCGRVACEEKWNSSKKIGRLKKEKKIFFLDQGFITGYFVIFKRFMIYNSFLF